MTSKPSTTFTAVAIDIAKLTHQALVLTRASEQRSSACLTSEVARYRNRSRAGQTASPLFGHAFTAHANRGSAEGQSSRCSLCARPD